jgi:large subunit ribosomal protein L25
VDLHEVSADQEMETEVTVHVVGDCIGVRVEFGILETVSHEVGVRCLPKDLPSFIEVDVSDLHVGGSIHVRELPQLPGVKFTDDPDRPVVACVEPAVEEVVAPVAAVPAEGEAAPAAGAGEPEAETPKEEASK